MLPGARNKYPGTWYLVPIRCRMMTYDVRVLACSVQLQIRCRSRRMMKLHLERNEYDSFDYTHIGFSLTIVHCTPVNCQLYCDNHE
jgi:hypothetical protein